MVHLYHNSWFRPNSPQMMQILVSIDGSIMTSFSSSPRRSSSSVVSLCLNTSLFYKKPCLIPLPALLFLHIVVNIVVLFSFSSQKSFNGVPVRALVLLLSFYFLLLGRTRN
ncbi:hypothetical protein C0J52_02511 [Blattella germanica]|nr:hypothetical protein C0J52_02511 [Blattella germanica]